MNRFLAVLACMAAFACGGKQQAPPDATVADTPKDNKHIPFTYMLQEQVRYIDSTPLPLSKHIRIDSGAEHTSTISRDELKQLAGRFMQPDFSDSVTKAAYSKDSYADATTNTVTFNYETTNKAYPVKKVFLNFTNNPSGFSALKWASLMQENGDTLTKLYWKSNSYFIITQIWPLGDGRSREVSTKVVWDAASEPATTGSQGGAPGKPADNKSAEQKK